MVPKDPKDKPLPKNRIALGRVRMAYTDAGKGPPILLVHGIPTSGYLWRNVIRDLQDEFRLIAPDLMGLGDTETPLDHSYDMEAQAEKLLELADRLGLGTFTLVCHDQGGAAAQWLAVQNPERIERFIMTNCVCYDNWPVPVVARFAKVFRFKPLATLMHRLRFSDMWGRSPVGIRRGVYNPGSLSDFAIAEYTKINRMGPEKFEQFRLFTVAGDCRYTLEAASKFGEFDRPTMIVWGGNDRWLNVSWGRKLYDDIAGARRMEVVPFAGHFLQEETPELVAKYIREFMEEV
jgi:pimeloyl-ACP methyl ester carboxylesterase